MRARACVHRRYGHTGDNFCVRRPTYPHAHSPTLVHARARTHTGSWEHVERYARYRPKVSVLEDRRAWWRYAYHIVLKEVVHARNW